MNNLFQKSSSHWVKYDSYELREFGDSLYLKPAPKAKPIVYDPLKDSDAMVLDALNVGMLQMKHADTDTVKTAVLDFVSKYGLLGFMTALPTTPHFLDYDAVYLPKNHFIKSETMSAEKYTSMFFPFEKPNLTKTKDKVVWTTENDREMLALAAAFSDSPMALNLSFQREYAENYEWLTTQFKDLAFTFVSSFIYYEDYDSNDEVTRSLYRQGMAAFGGIAPTYRIALLDKPTIVWDFHSLLLGIQMTFSFALTDDKKPLRCCRQCQNAFVAGSPNAVFCSARCKNQFNVYKGREVEL